MDVLGMRSQGWTIAEIAREYQLTTRPLSPSG